MTKFNKGDKVRFNDRTNTAWFGVEGIVEGQTQSGNYKLRLTTNAMGWASAYRAGTTATISEYSLELAEATALELPSEVDLSEIRVGDTVLVTYPADADTTHGVTHTRVDSREGKVECIQTGGHLYSTGNMLINSYLGGRSEAVYTLLERPEPEPVRTVASSAVGSQFKTSHGPMGKRLLTKVAEDKWTDFFFGSGYVHAANDRQAQQTFDARDGEWLEV